MEERLSTVFEPVRIKNMELRNRFVRSATYDACADENGYVTKRQIDLYSTLAKGGVGLIITGLAYVHRAGQVRKFQNSIAGDEFISGFKRLTGVAHKWGAKIAVQLFHAGREARLFNLPGEVPIAPSFVKVDPNFNREYRAMTEDEIWEIISAFGDGAKRARDAGFDAVQIHGAHAFLFSQFLSPFTNLRDDQWGLSLQNRLRIHNEVYRNIRQKVGEDYPVLIKIGVQDGFPGGLDFSEGRLAAKSLAEYGFDALEISLGLRGPSYEETEFRTNIDSLDREAYYRNWCRDIKKEVNVPVMLVGGLKTFELMEEIVRRKEADFISLCRPLIREPNIINEWEKGDHHRAKCVSCNKCIEVIREDRALRCIQEKRDN